MVRLNLADCKCVAGAILGGAASLRKLQYLDLTDNPLMPPGVEALLEGEWPDLTDLKLGGTSGGDSGAKALAASGFMPAAHAEEPTFRFEAPVDVQRSAPFVELDPGYVWRTTAAATVGAMAAATDMACEHARTREQFGRPIGSFQALQFRLAECQWRLLGLRLLVREAAWRADRDDPRALVVSALAWLYAREVGRLVTRHVHQVFGAIGFTRELGLTTLTGATATSRSLHPARAAAATVRAWRGWDGDDPPSTVLGGFSIASAAGARP